MTSPSFSQQLDTLINRQLSILWGAKSQIVLLLIQPPIIGYCIGLGWEGNSPEKTTFFIMAIAAVWLGCLNACCCIVRERGIYERERMFNLHIWSYLLSKTSVLSVIGAVQIALLLVVQNQFMELGSSITSQLLYFLYLWLTTIAATGLGILISACAKTTYVAVMTVPILLIPQVIFSEVLLQQHIERHLPSILEKATISKWCYDALLTLEKTGSTIEWGILGGSAAVLLLQLTLFLTLAAFKLKADDVL